jgi:hypothetical protein
MGFLRFKGRDVAYLKLVFFRGSFYELIDRLKISQCKNSRSGKVHEPLDTPSDAVHVKLVTSDYFTDYFIKA